MLTCDLSSHVDVVVRMIQHRWFFLDGWLAAAKMPVPDLIVLT